MRKKEKEQKADKIGRGGRDKTWISRIFKFHAYASQKISISPNELDQTSIVSLDLTKN